MQRFQFICALLCAGGVSLAAPTAPLIDEHFSSPDLPPKWEPLGRPNSFTIVDGTLRGVAAPDDPHGPSIGVPIEGHDLVVEFRVKFEKPGYFLFLIDGDSQFGGQAHLLRFVLTQGQVQLAQDRGSAVSKREQKEARDAATKAGTKVPPPTKEQLNDPKFYRTEMLAKQPANPTDGEWHHVHIALSGNEVVARVDDLPELRATGNVLDVNKSRLAVLIGQAGAVRIGDVVAANNAPQR